MQSSGPLTVKSTGIRGEGATGTVILTFVYSKHFYTLNIVLTMYQPCIKRYHLRRGMPFINGAHEDDTWLTQGWCHSSQG